eukprot:CAMPEP_0113940854 /NCGR_PEP_ID=MMETSP1339-20121228/6897_1 /TAXON_ID=94617 /ORGANISM="Fibrocapsa japonica" /LENGTH=237 /DNA_ID=CAMNT_0000944817 /DNA_START=270 /DNA_END=983 /DNA_ORIENTATION=- /assembly_acc=CAM_ASM_000762
MNLTDLSVFSASESDSIGLEFVLDISYTFLLIKDEVGEVHKELAGSYEGVIGSRAKDAIKNEAIFITFTEYFQDRKSVEARFRTAVQKRWDAHPSLHCTLDQFHVGRIKIPESVAKKQLESKVQIELNDEEQFLQEAAIVREQTQVEVNRIKLETDKILRTTTAEAGLIVSKAKVEANQITAQTTNEGTLMLVNAAGIETQEEITAFTYIRTLQNRENVEIDVNYLMPDNIIKTKAV